MYKKTPSTILKNTTFYYNIMLKQVSPVLQPDTEYGGRGPHDVDYPCKALKGMAVFLGATRAGAGHVQQQQKETLGPTPRHR